MTNTIYARDVERLEKEISKLHQKASEEANKEAKSQRKIVDIEKSITKHTSPSTLRSKQGQVERLRNELSRIADNKARIAKDLATKNTQLVQKREQLQQAELRQQQEQYRKQQQHERELQQELARLNTETAKLHAELNVVYDTQAILSEIFVIESEQAMIQGTCFNLAGIGLVTCEHAVRSDSRIFHPTDVGKKFPIEIVSSNSTIDLARIAVSDLPLNEGLPVGSADTIEPMDKILLAGFPNYRNGDSGIIMPGLVTGFRMLSGVRRILVNTPIVAGNSGGPVLSRTGHVIGIAATGADRMEDAGETEHHGVIPIDVLAILANQ